MLIMDNYTSQKIKITSFLLIIMVVFLHSYNLDMKQGNALIFVEKDYNWLIQNFISNGITRIAVPLFFLILLFYLVMQSIPQSQGFFTKKLIVDYNFTEWLNAIFVQPIPYQLWFLKDLIVMVLISPLIVFAIKKLKILFLSVIFVFWILSQDAVFLTSEALLFFSGGIYLSLYKPESIAFKTSNSYRMFFVWLLILAFKTFLPIFVNNAFLESILLKVSILIGIVAFWWMLDGFVNRFIGNKLFLFGMTFSFFIYLFHEPLLTIIKKVLFVLLSVSSFTSFIIYLVAPLITILLCVFVGVILKSKINFIYRLATGNR